ncbi:MAG TPA: sigma factor [Candidatus Limnocylindrales bacterium]
MRSEWEREYVEFVSVALPGLHRQAYLLTGDAHRADDVVQQACTNLYLHWRRARESVNLGAYSRAVLVKAAPPA